MNSASTQSETYPKSYSVFKMCDFNVDVVEIISFEIEQENALEFVPQHMITKEVVEAAIRNNGM